MYVISISSVHSYILPTTFEHPEDAIAMCIVLARSRGRVITNDLLAEEKCLKHAKHTVLFTRKKDGEIDPDLKYFIAEVAHPVAKEPVTGQFTINVSGDKFFKSTIAEVKAWLDGFMWAHDANDDEEYWLGVELELDKAFAIPTEHSKAWFLLDTDNPDGMVTSIEVEWEAINE